MDISMKLNKIEAINLIKKNIDLFCFFDKSYIFGSILKPDKYSEDIDVLLLYSTFSYDIQKSVNEIIEFIEQKTFYPADITALSFEEEKEIIKWVIVFDKEKVIKVALKYFHMIKKFVSSKNDLKFLVQSY